MRISAAQLDIRSLYPKPDVTLEKFVQADPKLTGLLLLVLTIGKSRVRHDSSATSWLGPRAAFFGQAHIWAIVESRGVAWRDNASSNSVLSGPWLNATLARKESQGP